MIEFTMPFRTYSLANQREHYMARARRTRKERLEAWTVCPRAELPCIVSLTRIAPRALDDDNLRGAMKAIRDGIADRLGVNDRDPRVRWVYGQRRGAPKEYAVHIAISEAE